MKDQLFEITAKNSEPGLKLGMMREYLQVYALRHMFEYGAFRNLSFLGGTALRLIYDCPRFSEDLDFSLVNAKGYDFQLFLSSIKKAFEDAAYDISIKLNMDRVVHSALLKFPGLIYEAGISNRKNQNLTIKIEIDTKPPAAAGLSRVLFNKYFPVTVTCYDKETLLAGKIRAILTRGYAKGRDYFDIVWMLTRWKEILPSILFLNNALKQGGHDAVTAASWRLLVWDKIMKSDWRVITNDVEKFLLRSSDIEMMKPEYIKDIVCTE